MIHGFILSILSSGSSMVGGSTRDTNHGTSRGSKSGLGVGIAASTPVLHARSASRRRSATSGCATARFLRSPGSDDEIEQLDGAVLEPLDQLPGRRHGSPRTERHPDCRSAGSARRRSRRPRPFLGGSKRRHERASVERATIRRLDSTEFEHRREDRSVLVIGVSQTGSRRRHARRGDDARLPDPALVKPPLARTEREDCEVGCPSLVESPPLSLKKITIGVLGRPRRVESESSTTPTARIHRLDHRGVDRVLLNESAPCGPLPAPRSARARDRFLRSRYFATSSFGPMQRGVHAVERQHGEKRRVVRPPR